MRFVSLFSGIGGLDLGLEREGHECVLQVENDPYCQQVLEKHWPDVRRIADVKEVTADDCKEADAIVGGFPCQPVSLAGRRQAQADPRWLWPWFAGLIADVRPRYAVMENVPGLLSAGMGEVLGDLSALRYDAWWGRVAAETVGAPHLRWRIFIVAYSTSGQPRRREQQSQGSEGAGNVAYASGERLERPKLLRQWITEHSGSSDTGELADPSGERSQGQRQPFKPIGATSLGDGQADESLYGRLSNQWTVEPDVGRVAHGVPARVDRLRALGNAVVPQVAEVIGRMIPV